MQPGHHYQKFEFHQQQEALATHSDFTSFSAQPFLDSWLQLVLHQGCFVEISFSSSSSDKITNTFKSHKKNLPMFQFLSNLEHL